SDRVKLMQAAYRASGEDRKRAFTLAAEQQAAMDARTQSLFEKIVSDHGKDPCVCDVGMNLLLQCYRMDAPADRLRTWADTTLNAAERFGPRYHRHVLVKAAEYTARNMKAPAVAAELALQA